LIVPKGLPPHLYKYQPFNAQTLTNLKRASIWFSAPVNVNDPYDCASWVVQADEVSEADFPRLLAYVRGRDPALAAGLTPEKLREAFISAARRAYGERRTIQREQRGIACFSATYTDIMMWSHYADGHRGFCLEFDTSQPPFSKALQVTYVDTPPLLNPVDVLVEDPSDDKNNALLRALVLTKARCWSYEQEWRLMHAEPSKLYGYGSRPLTGIYFGAEMPHAYKEIVALVTRGEAVQLHEMEHDRRSFTLHSRAVNYTPPPGGKQPPDQKV
jgi:hypothetical protein